MFSFLYLQQYGMSKLILQGVFMLSITLNTIAMPCIMKLAQRKKQQILDQKVNKSYSSISIKIINLLKWTAALQFIFNLFTIGFIVFW